MTNSTASIPVRKDIPNIGDQIIYGHRSLLRDPQVTHSSRIDADLNFRFPPPTDIIKIASLEFKLLTFNQLAKTLSHPSSLILAVSSETLSVGA